jgi:formylglycine-generating enzyme required for sulfatase activity
MTRTQAGMSATPPIPPPLPGHKTSRPRRRGLGRALLLVGSGLALGVLVMLLVFGLRKPAGPETPPGRESPKPGQEVTNSVGMKLRLIPAGTFRMGSPATELDRSDDEVPPHDVAITRPFFMGVYEVTQREYEAVMGYNPARFSAVNGGGPDHPVEQVSWEDADAFCRRLSDKQAEKLAGRVYRLPTEAEWEYACRAGTSTPFHFGSTLSSAQANFDGNFPYGGTRVGTYAERTAKVGSYAPNAFGLYDMHGNVWEWCSDRYDANYYRTSSKNDPAGPPDGGRRVHRGGSWYSKGRKCRSAYREHGQPDDRYDNIGFRVVMPSS